MTFRTMEIFLTVVQQNSMSKAAELLHIAQPTISQAIKETEQEYGVTLFQRIGKKLFITAEGEKLAGYIQIIVATYQKMNDSMAELTTHPTIHLGATITIGQTLLIPAIKQFEQEHPEATVTIVIDNTHRIESLLLENKIDLAFAEGTVKHRDLVSHPLIEDQLVLVCPLGHPLLTTSASFAEMVQYPFLVREEGSGTRELFAQALEQQAQTIQVKWTAHSFAAILGAVEAGQGITVVSRLIAEKYKQQAAVDYTPISNQSMTRTFSLVYHKNKQLTATMNALVTYFHMQKM